MNFEHFSVDEKTDHITFNKNDDIYRIERDVFKSHGVDIDNIKTYKEYDKIYNLLEEAVVDVIVARALSRPGNSLKKQWVQALISFDLNNLEKLNEKLHQRSKLKLFN